MVGDTGHHGAGSVDRDALAHRAAELFDAAVSTDAALRAVLRTAVPAFCDWCVIDYYAADGELTAVHSGYPDERQEALILDIRRRYRVERGENGDVLAALASGQPLLYPDMTEIASVRLTAEESELLEELGLKSSIVVPIHVNRQPLGVVSFVSMSRHYGDDDLAAAQQFAAGCERVLSRQREEDEVKRLLALSETLYASSPVGLALLDPSLRFRALNAKLAALGSAPATACIGRTPTEVLGDLGARLQGICRGVLDKQQPVAEAELTTVTATDRGAARHWLVSCRPAALEPGVWGVSCVVQDITGLKRAEQRAAFLAHAGEILDSSLDYRQTLARVARLAVPDIADWCSISMLDEHGRMYRLAVAHRDAAKDRLGQELIEREALPADAPAGAASAMRAARTQVLEDFPDALLTRSLRDPRSRAIVRALGLGSSISVPLIARGKILGAISLLSETRFRFDATDVELAEELARRAAVSIDNARLYTEHTRIAHTLQASLLPQRLPEIPGLRLAARYRPVGELNEVGGDFYDVYLRSTGEWLVVIGDVTGHGAKAAATTALIRYTLRAAALHPGATVTLLHELNRAMLTQDAGLCTVALLSIRVPITNPIELSVCLAGHPPPLMLRASGEITEVGAPGTMLGYVPDPDLSEIPVRFAVGDTMLLYTDGLTDAAPPRSGHAELLHWLRSGASDDLDALLARLETRALKTADGRPRDDIALLALRANPPSAPRR